MRIIIDLQGAQSESCFRGIGRYSISLAKAIVRNRGTHEIFILLNELFPDTIEKIRESFTGILPKHHIMVFGAVGPVNELNIKNEWRVLASELLREKLIKDLDPDFVLVSSLFEGASNNTISSVGKYFPEIQTAVIFYDLIPLLYPKTYLPTLFVKKWYYRKLEFLKQADLLLAISKSAQKEAIDQLGIEEERIISISSAADAAFSRVDISAETISMLRTRFGIKRSFLMHTSVFEPRKNFEGLIKAFGLLPTALRKEYQLVLVCNLGNEQRKLRNVATKAGLDHDDLVLTGYVSDEELLLLYSSCHLFIFPSFHEGFGLPALEAMSCGAAAIGSSTSSIPEVIGREDALFDPASSESMACLIERVLTNPSFWQSLKQHAVHQSRQFSWDKSAIIAISALEKIYKEKVEEDCNNSYRKLIDEISRIDSKIKPTNQDIISTEAAIEHNEKLAYKMKRYFRIQDKCPKADGIA
ncbi:Mannosylfructose-phosphate synthase [Sporomusa ovata DSM 2662]|nr:glycosyltransferase family 1 protein [Sporomusa ovata]EQB27017.1 glycosyl transferase group 1 [Sporomusa ovata DSM 2662]